MPTYLGICWFLLFCALLVSMPAPCSFLKLCGLGLCLSCVCQPTEPCALSLVVKCLLLLSSFLYCSSFCGCPCLLQEDKPLGGQAPSMQSTYAQAGGESSSPNTHPHTHTHTGTHIHTHLQARSSRPMPPGLCPACAEAVPELYQCSTGDVAAKCTGAVSGLYQACAGARPVL